MGQGSRGRRILRPGTLEMYAGRIKIPRLESTDAVFFHGTTENYHQPVFKIRRESSVASWTN